VAWVAGAVADVQVADVTEADDGSLRGGVGAAMLPRSGPATKFPGGVGQRVRAALNGGCRERRRRSPHVNALTRQRE